MNNKDNLIDLVIHDLTGLLSIVTTGVNKLLSKQDKYGPITAKQQEMLNMILRNSGKARNFLNEIIEIYRSEEGLFKKEYFSVHDILKESILEALEIVNLDNVEMFLNESSGDKFYFVLKDYGIIVDISGKYNKNSFSHDKKKIQQILRNLFTNALKHKREKMVIKISGDDNLIITVEDDGCGIPQEKRDFIFTRFSHLKSKQATFSKTDGLGFGLACVKSMLETIDGTIDMTSTEGRGTSFTVSIPPLRQTGVE